MVERPIGFLKIIRENCNYDLVLDLVNALITTSKHKDGVYSYSYSNVVDKNIKMHDVSFREFKLGYKFSIDNKTGFIINEKNYKNNFEKLINIIPILVMLNFTKHDFFGQSVPLDAFSFLYQIYDYSKTYETKNNSMVISFDGEKFTITFKNNFTEDVHAFKILDSGNAEYTTKKGNMPGGLFISDNYPLASLVVIDEVKEYLRRNYFLIDELHKLAPLS
ncbi:MAG: hypothetical protein MJ244_04630 [Clostridia bacterium]|nr:hypothetical protein [Clostridia bacterium]